MALKDIYELLLVIAFCTSLHNSLATDVSSVIPSHTPLTCPKDLSCAGRCSNTQVWDNGLSTNPHCHCDTKCSIFKDCCADYQQYCGNHSVPDNTAQRYECVQLNASRPGMWMVTKCPANYTNQHVINACLASSQPNVVLTYGTLMDHLPVISLFTDTAYRNRFCAECNGIVGDYVISYFDLRIECDIKPPQGYSYSQIIDYYLRYCPSVEMGVMEKVKTRWCYPTVSSCPDGASGELREACLNSPTNIVYHSDTKDDYRNKYCLACNNLTVAKMQCGPQHSENNFFRPLSFEVLMGFDKFGDEVKIRPKKVGQSCGKNELYDQYLELCRSAIRDPTQGISDKYRMHLWASPLDGQAVNMTQAEFTDSLATRFNLRTQQIEIKKLTVEKRAVSLSFDLHASKTGASETTRAPQGDGESRSRRDASLPVLPITALLDFNASFEVRCDGRPWEVIKVTARRLACVKPEVYQPDEYRLIPLEPMVAVLNKTGERLTQKHFYTIRHNESVPLDRGTLFICRSVFSVGCSHVMLALRSEEYVIYDNKSLLYIPVGQLYPREEYIMEDDTPWVCTNETSHLHRNYTIENGTEAFVMTAPPPSDHVTARRYLTIIGLSISVFSLFLVLVVHVILRDLRTPLPGKNLMGLSLSLFLAHFWYLFASGEMDKPVFCKAAAVVTHYLFLVTFGCTAVVSYDTRRTFNQKIAKAHAIGTAHYSTRLIVYILLSWGVPLVAVCTCFALDWYGVVTIGYGSSTSCWISNVDAQLIAFATPVGCVLVFNIIAFSQTIYAISSARKQTHSVKTSHVTRPSTVKIYIRLVSLMGFSWFFGISAALIHDALMYPFVVLTTLQGLYIFLAFICKARVLRMLKEKLPLRRKSARAHHGRDSKGTVTTDATSTTPYARAEEQSETNI